ncbi:MAG TPA: hypothetical protein VH120_07960, partial [Gemmataceae bacterium]|nr:hypothetical protein [Gemmataceae bacterium]
VLQRCFVRPPGVRAPDGWRGIVFSLSATGIGVTLPLAVERGTNMEIEAWNLPGAPILRARVVHIAKLQFVWLTGGELSRRLDPDELSAWLTTVTAGT